MTGREEAARGGVLLPRGIARRSPTRVFARRVYYLAEVDSTNRLAADLAARGEPEGTVVVADHQTAGRGRWERRWESPAGKDLLFSLILRPDASPRTVLPVTLAFSAAVAGTLSDLTGQEIGVKWPNDVYATGKKICGILAEASTSGERAAFVVVGFGINVNASADEFPAEFADRSCSCHTLTGRVWDRCEVLVRVLAALERTYVDFAAGGFGDFQEVYKSKLVILGRDVVVRGSKGEAIARVVDVAPDGGLVVDMPDGTATLYDDEVTLIVGKDG
jgi:BirA family biotin operon repressor/biotin-[acetyl-CoA-carboxylase] ligase